MNPWAPGAIPFFLLATKVLRERQRQDRTQENTKALGGICHCRVRVGCVTAE